MLRNEFIFCPRGTGNFSNRFYETLCYGRVPVILNTDMELPFENKINWKDFIVISQTINKIPEDVISFWNTKNMQEVQQKCSDVYKELESMDYYIEKVNEYFT